jgi:hypothetical protein
LAVLLAPSQQHCKHSLPIREERSDLPLHRQPVQQVVKRAHWQFVLQHIANHGACGSFADFVPDAMAVVKIAEGTASLLVAEEIIPSKFRNVGLPLESQGKQGNRSKTDRDQRARSGSKAKRTRHGNNGMRCGG